MRRFTLVPFALLSHLAAQSPAFVPLGHPNGWFAPHGVSADGRVAVGMSYLNPGSFGIPGDFARRWREGIGFDYPGPSPEPTASWAADCSSDGRVMCGGNGHAVFGDLEAWVRDGNSTAHAGSPAGHDTSDLLGVSGDGRIAVGYGGHQSNANLFEAARYDLRNDRWTNLGFLPGAGDSKALATNADGSVIVGWSTDPAVLYSTAFRWTAAGMVAIPHLVGGNEAVASAVNAAGDTVVGSDYVVDAQWNSTQTAFKWRSDTGTVALGGLPGGDGSSIAFDVSEDGMFTVGTADVGGSWGAFVHDDQSGMRRLDEVLIEAGLGAQIAGFEFIGANSIAGHGPDYWIAGECYDVNSNASAFLVHVALGAARTSFLGGGCGSSVSTLTATAPVLGTTSDLALGAAVPGATAAFMVGLQLAAGIAFDECEVWFDPLVALALPLHIVDASGASHAPLAVPNVLGLTGLRLSAQAVVFPTAAPMGFDLSDAVGLVLGR
ncbi:MAG: hypothetical protein U1F36_19480 [Planctomycetota bacterium]